MSFFIGYSHEKVSGMQKTRRGGEESLPEVQGEYAENQNADETEQIEATGDSFIIAGGLHAIADGLHAIARSIKLLADPANEEDIDEGPTYLDGK